MTPTCFLLAQLATGEANDSNFYAIMLKLFEGENKVNLINGCSMFCMLLGLKLENEKALRVEWKRVKGGYLGVKGKVLGVIERKRGKMKRSNDFSTFCVEVIALL
jgi:hypothetical protein